MVALKMFVGLLILIAILATSGSVGYIFLKYITHDSPFFKDPEYKIIDTMFCIPVGMLIILLLIALGVVAHGLGSSLIN